MGFVGALHSLRSFRRRLPLALGRINRSSGSSLLAMVSAAKLHSRQYIREPFFGLRLLPIFSTGWLRFRPSADRRLMAPPGAASPLNLAVCPSAACSPGSSTKVPRALAKWAARPAAASVGICAVAGHSAHIPQSRLAPPLLGVMAKAGYS